MFITKPKIFISSTIVDMPSERKAALNAVNKAGGVPIMSEFTMVAVSKDAVTACLDHVRSSDIYVLVLGGRYGWQPDGRESITELEYNTAVTKGISILVFSTTYPKEELQKTFEKSVEVKFFRKIITDAFQFESELQKSLEAEINRRQQVYFGRTESVYSNLVKIFFPNHLYRAELLIDKKAINKELKDKGQKRLYKPSLFDYVIADLRLKEIRFPGDWILHGKSIVTFHDLRDSTLPLTKIIDNGTAEKFSCEEFYSDSVDDLNSFRYLLKRCLETKLHKLKIRWIKEERIFAFIPLEKDKNEQWEPRKIEWSKIKKATRTVVDVKADLKDNNNVFNLKCLAFRADFHLLENQWHLSIKPEWIFLWPSLAPCDLAYKNIQWLKRNERNIHVFNHFNFILRYLQPSTSDLLFVEYADYKFLRIGNMETFDFSPIVPDEMWRGLESTVSNNKLSDKGGDVDLFQL